MNSSVGGIKTSFLPCYFHIPLYIYTLVSPLLQTLLPAHPNMATPRYPPEDPGMILVMVCVIVMLAKLNRFWEGNTYNLVVQCLHNCPLKLQT